MKKEYIAAKVVEVVGSKGAAVAAPLVPGTPVVIPNWGAADVVFRSSDEWTLRSSGTEKLPKIGEIVYIDPQLRPSDQVAKLWISEEDFNLAAASQVNSRDIPKIARPAPFSGNQSKYARKQVLKHTAVILDAPPTALAAA